MRSAKNVLILVAVVIVGMIWLSRAPADEFSKEDNVKLNMKLIGKTVSAL